MKYFELERGTRQGDPISAYLFILVLKVVLQSSNQIRTMINDSKHSCSKHLNIFCILHMPVTPLSLLTAKHL